MKRKSILQNWELEDRGTYYALRGQVLDDTRWEYGTWVQTSMLLNIDFEHNKAETLNTIYELR